MLFSLLVLMTSCFDYEKNTCEQLWRS